MSDHIVLRSMAAAEPDDTGEALRFTVHGEGDRGVTIECPHDQVENMIPFLIDLARDAAARRKEEPRSSFARAEQLDVDPAAISHASFMVDPEINDIVLVLRMFGFDLGFSLTPEHLAGLKRELDRILPALGIEEKRPHHGHDHHH